MAIRIWSIGHSNHSLEELVALLEKHQVSRIADIRTVPKSRRNPQFHTDSLAESLPGHGIAYRHHPDLGGWRKTAKDSPNDAWRNRSFRGYADFAMTGEFSRGLTELREIAGSERTAMMCSEALWWRCHRRLVADRLVAGEDTVCHIGSDGRVTPHELTSFAVVSPDGEITYPAE
ncbi:MAG: DUF488 domain-containing protein [Actinomycetota bacterium]|nr:DUF488 domain-containing protein [Actinomycetota bacterium]